MSLNGTEGKKSNPFERIWGSDPPKPDLIEVRDPFSHINEIQMKLRRNLKTNPNEIDSSVVFQSVAAEDVSRVAFLSSVSSCLLFLTPPSVNSSIYPLFSTWVLLPLHPPSLLYLIFLLCYHLSPSVPASPSSLVLSLLSVAITLLL